MDDEPERVGLLGFLVVWTAASAFGLAVWAAIIVIVAGLQLLA